MVIGLLLMVLALANDAIFRFIRAAGSWLLAIGIVATVGGLIYFFAGILHQSEISANPPDRTREPEPQAEITAPVNKTGPGWHCTWCWAPLEEGSHYCNNCGRKIG
jgi:hypothetical protein